MTRYTITPVPQPALSTARVWDVTGGSEPYVVRCSGQDGEWTCSCADFKFRRALRRIQGGCRHVKAVVESLNVEEMQETACQVA